MLRKGLQTISSHCGVTGKENALNNDAVTREDRFCTSLLYSQTFHLKINKNNEFKMILGFTSFSQVDLKQHAIVK